MRYRIVDVFATEKYAGNQLAVVFEEGRLSSGEMQKIAREFNFSETTFIQGRKGGKEELWGVRIFTPREELPFAGHPTLGTAWCIRADELGGEAHVITLDLKAGRIPVDFQSGGDGREVIWMRQLAPTFGHTVDTSTAARLLSLDEKDVDHRFPVQEVSTGLPFLLVPLKTLDAVRRARPNVALLEELAGGGEVRSLFLFAPETYEAGNDFNARLLADSSGVPEDPATGSANGCLAAYLVKHRYSGSTKVVARVEQGYEIGRRSLLLLDAEERAGEIHIRVGGGVVPVALGELI